MNTFYIDGKYVSEDESVISVNDMSVLRGYGVFDFLRTYNRRPFRLKEHIDRLSRSAQLIDLPLPCSKEEIYDISMETLARNDDYKEANIRIVVTGGVSADSITPQNNSKLMVMVTKMHVCPAEWYENGAAIITTSDERYIPGAKTTNYIAAILAMGRARQQQAIESVYVDRYGRLLEGTTTNLFAFIGDKLVTPEQSILPGITRQTVLELVKDDFKIEIRDIHKDEMRMMDEIFITASNKEIVPVVRIDSLEVSSGKPGVRTRQIMQHFSEFTHQYGMQGA